MELRAIALTLTSISLTSIFFVVVTTSAYANIGQVIIQSGETNIERGKGEFESIDKGFEMKSMDTVRTKNGRTAIEFIDDTRVDVTENSKLIMDDFVYDPNTKTGSLSLKASFGTVRYASGQIAKNSRQNIKIRTPTAVVGVRGTDFSMTIDELGSSTIVLLPSCNTNGNCVVGEITVSSEVGMVIMNQAFQATVVPSPYTEPSRPVILELDENSILNLLVRRVPTELDESVEEARVKKLANFLGIDFLQFDAFKTNELLGVENSTWATELDMDFLSSDLLPNILDILNEQLTLQMRSEFDKKKDGMQLGKNPDTGVEIYDYGSNWRFKRDGNGNIFQADLSKNYTYRINLKQDEIELYDIPIGEGGSNEINIIQVR